MKFSMTGQPNVTFNTGDCIGRFDCTCIHFLLSLFNDNYLFS